MSGIGATTAVARGRLWRLTDIPINYHKPPKKTNSVITDVIHGGAWCNRMVAMQEDCYSISPADKPINEVLQSTTLAGHSE